MNWSVMNVEFYKRSVVNRSVSNLFCFELSVMNRPVYGYNSCVARALFPATNASMKTVYFLSFRRNSTWRQRVSSAIHTPKSLSLNYICKHAYPSILLKINKKHWRMVGAVTGCALFVTSHYYVI